MKFLLELGGLLGGALGTLLITRLLRRRKRRFDSSARPASDSLADALGGTPARAHSCECRPAHSCVCADGRVSYLAYL